MSEFILRSGDYGSEATLYIKEGGSLEAYGHCARMGIT